MSERIKKPSTKKYYDDVSVGKRTKQIVYLAEEEDKAAMFAQFIKSGDRKQTVVVVRSKRRADELCAYLKSQEIITTAIHGNHRAQQIEEAAKAFNASELNIIITTDMILQALDLKNIQTIINYDLPSEHERYFSRLILVDEVGESISFVSAEEEGYLSIIEMRLKDEIPQEEIEGFVAAGDDKAVHSVKERKKKPRHRKQRLKKPRKAKEE